MPTGQANERSKAYLEMSDTTLELMGPEHQPLPLEGTSDEQALALFKSLLYNSPDDRRALSNAIHCWDLIPKFSGEYLNQADELPDAHTCEFSFYHKKLKMVLFPGTIYRGDPKSEETSTTRRYPGGREQAVEQALVKIAAEQAEMLEVNGRPVYQVIFSIRHIRDVLATLGSTCNHQQVVESLEILSSSLLTISDEQGKSIQRSPILPGFSCTSKTGKASTSPDAQWMVTLHPLVAHSIRHATYRQYNIARFAGHRAYGVYLLRQIILNATNISAEHPHRIRYTTLRQLTSGLNYSRTRDGISYLEKEIKSMVKSGCLSDYEREDHYAQRRGKGRPALTDATFTLYPSDTLVAEVKASSKRQGHAEQTLKLSRMHRKERQLGLPLG
jgi:hypothetical protein